MELMGPLTGNILAVRGGYTVLVGDIVHTRDCPSQPWQATERLVDHAGAYNWAGHAAMDPETTRIMRRRCGRWLEVRPA